MYTPETPLVGPAWDLRHGELKVAENRRHLVHADGTPFTWIGDTAWELFHRFSPEEAERYFENRRKKGFTVINAALLSECNGLAEPNPQRHRPLLQSGGQWDPARPDVRGAQDYWTDVETILKLAEQVGLHLALLPAWGSYVTGLGGLASEHPRIFTRENALPFGRFLGKRFQKYRHVIWILGGQAPTLADGRDYRAVWRAMAEGLAEGLTGQRPRWDQPHPAWEKLLMTCYPARGCSSAADYNADCWLSFHAVHSGDQGRNWPCHEQVTAAYCQEPPRPVLDVHARYENHPVGGQLAAGYYDDFDVRQAAYWSVFAGAFGCNYGCSEVWQKFMPGGLPLFGARAFWADAMDTPGAWDMLNLRRLLLSRPFLSRGPSYSTVLAGQGSGVHHVQATRGDGYCFVYVPTANPFTVQLQKVSGATLRSWWYNPRTGTAMQVGEFPNTGSRAFVPPGKPGRGNDWVLVLDDAARQFTPPGARSMHNP